MPKDFPDNLPPSERLAALDEFLNVSSDRITEENLDNIDLHSSETTVEEKRAAAEMLREKADNLEETANFQAAFTTELNRKPEIYKKPKNHDVRNTIIGTLCGVAFIAAVAYSAPTENMPKWLQPHVGTLKEYVDTGIKKIENIPNLILKP